MNKQTQDTVFSSSNEEWATPNWLYKRLDEIFHFKLDAAASAENNKCNHYFSKLTSAFEHEWTPDPVWLNPPYGRGLRRWIEKVVEESIKGSTIVALLPSRTDTIWFTMVRQYARQLLFLEGRLKFQGAKWLAPFPSLIAIFSDKEWDLSSMESLAWIPKIEKPSSLCSFKKVSNDSKDS